MLRSGSAMNEQRTNMKRIKLTILMSLISLISFGQDYEFYFKQAVDEITDMLEDRKPVDFKRAVFLTENAYYKGQLDYSNFCNQLTKISVKLNQMIVNKGLQGYKTAGNWAIFSYMTEKIPENNFQPMQYDFENFMGDSDYESFMVSTLLTTRKGNCHSLPYLYKILADEVNVEAFVSTAPMHVYNKHKDEQGKWWNLELTSGTFSRTSFIIESFNVSDAGMESGLYMKPLDGKELLVLCLSDLMDYYEKKTGKYYGEIVQTGCDIGIKYCKASLLQLWKFDELKYRLDKEMESKGFTNYNQISNDPKLVALFEEVKSTEKYIKEIGYSSLTPQQYKEKVEEIENGKYSQTKN